MVRPYQQNNLHITSSYDKPIVASTGYAQIRTSQNPSFIYWLLHSRTFLRKVLLRCTGSSYPAINSSDLKEIYVSIPPLEDQDQYARALNSISQKCNIEESLVCHLENLKSGLLQQMFV
jgi:type I restriction enzyme S subunit